MRRTLRPRAALAMLAVIVAGCSNAPAGTGSSGGNSIAATREKAVKFAECMRDNGVSAFPDPDPDASGELTIDGIANGLVAGPEHRGVREGHQRVQGPGAAGVHGPQEERPGAGECPQVRPMHA